MVELRRPARNKHAWGVAVAGWELLVLAPTSASVHAAEILRAPGDLYAAVQATAAVQMNVPLGAQMFVHVQGSVTINGTGALHPYGLLLLCDFTSLALNEASTGWICTFRNQTMHRSWIYSSKSSLWFVCHAWKEDISTMEHSLPNVYLLVQLLRCTSLSLQRSMQLLQRL
jgi:hypothetical protein